MNCDDEMLFLELCLRIHRGHTYMTSKLGGGGLSPKNKQKEQKQLITVHDNGGGAQRSETVEEVSGTAH